MKTVLRYLIALIFIASGFVKAVDPVGFSFKLEEYFSPPVFNMPFLEEYALPIAIFVCGLEILLGLMLLMKIKLKNTLVALIALCLFFLFLTFYSAYFNVVTDCGCFGDAMKLTPWQSFWKDVALLVGLIILWLAYRKSSAADQPAGCLKQPFIWVGMLITAIFMYWGIKHEPLIDFRHYKIGTDLNAEKQKIAANPSEYKTFYVLKNNKTGAEKKVNQDEYVLDKTLWDTRTPWEIQKDKTTSEIVKQGYESEIVKFRIEDENGNDLTEKILQADKAVLVFAYHPKKVAVEDIIAAENAVKDNAVVYGVSTLPGTFKQIPNGMMDGTAIKTIARSNPFVLELRKGKIVVKKSLKDYLKS